MTHDLEALFARATAAHEAGRWQDAERDYRAVLAADPGHARTLHQFGVLAFQTGNHGVAAAFIGRAIAAEPGVADFHNALGGALLAAGRIGEARRAFESALALDPASAEARNNLANVLLASGERDGAIAIYRDLLAAAPADADLHHNLGRALEAAGRIGEALSHFRAAQALRPGDALILAHLGEALCRSEAWDEAAAVCAQAVGIAPDSPVALTSMGNALMGQRRFDAAIAAFSKAAARAPELPELQMNLGVAFHAAGKLADAASCFEKLLAAGPEMRVRGALARTYAALGRREEALALYRAVLAEAPDDHDSRLEFGLLLNDLGRHGEGLGEIAKGPGLVSLALAPAPRPVLQRVPFEAPAPHFIGGWFLRDPTICERLIALFEAGSARHRQGRTSRGVDPAIKKATDLVIFPRDLGSPDHAPVADYLRELEACLGDYASQWPHLDDIFSCVGVVPFQIQRYRVGEHFQAPHSERMTFGLMHRAFAWMTYLNDVAEGGVTRFHAYGLDVKPERGKTLIWPAEWTHVHAGLPVTRGTKYVITGWMHFPHPSA